MDITITADEYVVARGNTTIVKVFDLDEATRVDADASAVGYVVLIELSKKEAISVFIA